MSDARPVGTGKAIQRILIALLLFAVVAFAAYRLRGLNEEKSFPTTTAKNGEFLSFVRSRGEFIARRSAPILAPLNVPDLRIVWLAPAGGQVSAGDTVIRFDPSSAERQLAERRASLEEATTKLQQAEAEVRITAEQDRLDLANAKYEVQRAKLEVSRAEIVSAMQAEQARIALSVSDEKLLVQQATVELHQAAGAARISSLTRLHDQAAGELELTQYRLSRMEMKAPGDGIVVYMQNYALGSNARQFQVGDQVFAGVSIGEIPDLNTLEVEGKIDEIDRGQVEPGDEVRIRIDALPELVLKAQLASISPLTQQSYEFPPTKSFRAYSPLTNPDPRLRPGMAATMEIIVERIADAVIIPSEAVFTKNGKPTVYLVKEGAYLPTEIEIIARNPEEFAVNGLASGAVITLVDVEDAL